MKRPLFLLFFGVFVSFLGFGAIYFEYIAAGVALIALGTWLEIMGIVQHKKQIDQTPEE